MYRTGSWHQIKNTQTVHSLPKGTRCFFHFQSRIHTPDRALPSHFAQTSHQRYPSFPIGTLHFPPKPIGKAPPTRGAFLSKMLSDTKSYMASDPPSPSGQGPLPLAVDETSSLPITGTIHFTILLLSVGIPQANLFILDGETIDGQ